MILVRRQNRFFLRPGEIRRISKGDCEEVAGEAERKHGEGGVVEPNENISRRRKPLALLKAIDGSGGKQEPRMNF